MVEPTRILDQYIDSGLIIEGSNKEDYNSLIATADQLAGYIKIQKLSEILIAILTDFQENFTVIELTMNLIRTNWKFFKSNDTPHLLIRALLLDGIEQNISNENFSAVVYLSFKNLKRHTQIDSPKERKIINGFLNKIISFHQEKSQEQYSIKKVPLNFNFDAIPIIKPTEIAGVETIDADSHAEILDKKIRTSLKKQFQKVGTDFSKILDSFTSRNELIWWKESLFSRKEGKSYRDLEDATRVITLASDLAEKVLVYTPASVESLLKETLRKVTPENKKYKLKDFIEELQKENYKFSPWNIQTEKELLAQYIDGSKDLSTTSDSIEIVFQKKTGIAYDLEVSMYELVVWLFNDFQIKKILTKDE